MCGVESIENAPRCIDADLDLMHSHFLGKEIQYDRFS